MNRLVVAPLLFVSVFGLGACSQHAETGHSGHAAVSGSDVLPGSELSQADVMFLQGMIPHHEQAVEMVGLVNRGSTSNPEVLALAGQIRAAQKPEINDMTQWLVEGGYPVAGVHSGHGGHQMAGMLSVDELDALRNSSGESFDRKWLEGMRAHHVGAVVMAEQVLASSGDPRVRVLAEGIVASQTAEISRIDSLLK